MRHNVAENDAGVQVEWYSGQMDGREAMVGLDVAAGSAVWCLVSSSAVEELQVTVVVAR